MLRQRWLQAPKAILGAVNACFCVPVFVWTAVGRRDRVLSALSGVFEGREGFPVSVPAGPGWWESDEWMSICKYIELPPRVYVKCRKLPAATSNEGWHASVPASCAAGFPERGTVHGDVLCTEPFGEREWRGSRLNKQ